MKCELGLSLDHPFDEQLPEDFAPWSESAGTGLLPWDGLQGHRARICIEACEGQALTHTDVIPQAAVTSFNKESALKSEYCKWII